MASTAGPLGQKKSRAWLNENLERDTQWSASKGEIKPCLGNEGIPTICYIPATPIPQNIVLIFFP
jgi:hypothetical protein